MTDAPTDPADTPDLLAFAFATLIVVGATFLGSYVVNEVLRRKECRECER